MLTGRGGRRPLQDFPFPSNRGMIRGWHIFFRQEYAFFISVAAIIGILLFLFTLLLPTFEEIKLLIQKAGIKTEYFKTAIKALVISYLTEFTADTCRDCGQSALASKAELTGKTAIFIISLPLLITLLNTALSFQGE